MITLILYGQVAVGITAIQGLSVVTEFSPGLVEFGQHYSLYFNTKMNRAGWNIICYTYILKFMNIYRSSDFKYWVGLAAVILILFFGVSDRQFSVLFTFSGTLQTFGFALVVLKIKRSRSVSGLSR